MAPKARAASKAAPAAPATKAKAPPKAATKAAPKAKAAAAAPAPKAAPKTKAAAAPKAAPKTKTAAASKATKTKAAEDAKTNGEDAPAPKTNGAASRKRKAESVEDDAPEDLKNAQQAKRVKAEPKAAPKKPVARAVTRRGPPAVTNEIPSKPLDIWVFGEGSSGELGLGSTRHEGKKPIDVKRPRINHLLDAEKVGVVQVACGGMHVVALTRDNKILTWGVNDDRALGRDTAWEGGLRDKDDEDSDDEDDDDTGVNPNESTPNEVNLSAFPINTRFSQVAATDSASFVVTEHGDVYGWGTFRGSDGIIGFSRDVRIQPTPERIPELKNITKLACGSNHVIALDKDGKVFTWGCGGQFQLGRKAVSRHDGNKAGLKPEACGKFTVKKHAVDVAAGSYHSFYVDTDGKVWSWGLNNYSQTGQTTNTGEDSAMILAPAVVERLQEFEITQIAGGEHHTVACTKDGQLLTWGRVDGHQVGQPSSLFNEENTLYDENKKPRVLMKPTAAQGVKATFVAAGTDTSFAISPEGKAYSFGFSANYQTGQGTTDDVEVPTVIANSAVADRKITFAGAGGQYSLLAANHE